MNYVEMLKNLRNDSDITQNEIAKEIGISRKYYSMYETGYRNISLMKLDKLLLKYNLSLDYILELNKSKTYDNLKPIKIKKYSQNIKKIRKYLHLTQIEMAKKINCSQQSLSLYENGEVLMPIEILKILCKKTKISADAITGKLKLTQEDLDKLNQDNKKQDK